MTARIREVERLDHFLDSSPLGAAFRENWTVNAEGKRAIATYIAEQLVGNQNIALDAGSTSYEVAKAIALHTSPWRPENVVTTNIAVALLLPLFNIPCHLVGGPLDPLHLCTLPTPRSCSVALPATMSFVGVLSGASANIQDPELVLRFRRPDQLPFKKRLMRLSSPVFCGIDRSKWELPFDGIHELKVSAHHLVLVVDQHPFTNVGQKSPDPRPWTVVVAGREI